MLYEYECPKCGDALTAFNSVDKRHLESPECSCGTKTSLVTSVPAHPVMNPARPVKRAKNA